MTSSNQKRCIELMFNIDGFRHYSGRGMFGKKCAAIESDTLQPSDIILEIVHQAIMSDDFSKNDMIDLLESLGDSRTDSMGLGTVIYWPHLEMGK